MSKVPIKQPLPSRSCQHLDAYALGQAAYLSNHCRSNIPLCCDTLEKVKEFVRGYDEEHCDMAFNYL